MVEKPVGKYFIVYLMREDLALQVISVLRYPIFLLFVELDPQFRLLLFVVGLESHSVEVESLPWGKVEVVLVLLEGLLDGLLPLELLMADLDEQSNHLSNLMIDEALPHQGEADERYPIQLPLLLALETLAEVLLYY